MGLGLGLGLTVVSPVIACLVEVYGAELGRGRSALMLPLLMIRPPGRAKAD